MHWPYWRTGKNTEAETRVKGIQVLIGALGLEDAECFMAANSSDRFNYTEWRRLGFSDMALRRLAASANQISSHLPSQPKVES